MLPDAEQDRFIITRHAAALQRVTMYNARLACAGLVKNALSRTPPTHLKCRQSSKWHTGEDETKNRRVIVMPVDLR
jgi:hypothetical protein